MLTGWKVNPRSWFTISQVNYQIELQSQPRRCPPPSSAPQVAPQPQLIDAQLIDLAKLQQFLKAGQLREADQETCQLMLQAVGRQSNGWLRPADIESFPCQILQAIDQLWLQSSNCRFGFSMQQRIWEEVNRDYEQFGEQVGWKITSGWAAFVNRGWLAYDDMNFSYTAPAGYFPSGWTSNCDLPTCIGGCCYIGLEDVFDRLTTCER
jgi:GUN4-like